MKSDVVVVNSQGDGFTKALEIAKNTAKYEGLSKKSTLHVQLMTEEMLSLASIVTGAESISFWIEKEGDKFAFHFSAKTVMNQEKKAELLSAATSRKNEAAKSFLGKLRDAFENAMLADPDHSEDIPEDIMGDLALCCYPFREGFMKDIASISVGATHEVKKFRINLDNSLKYDYFTAYGQLSITALTLRGGYAFGGRQTLRSKDGKTAGAYDGGFFLTVQALYKF